MNILRFTFSWALMILAATSFLPQNNLSASPQAKPAKTPTLPKPTIKEDSAASDSVELESILAIDRKDFKEVKTPKTDAEMISEINRLISAKWTSVKVTQVRTASDEEFMRRAYLDMTGIVPTVTQARSFLNSKNPTKRADLVERLLLSPRFATHLATTWRNRILPPSRVQADQFVQTQGLQRWLRDRFAKNERFDNLVSDFLSTTGDPNQGPGLFYTANELKPEKLAASTARLFMGLQIQCAQCHDHPFDNWSQKEFWEYAAFFAKIQGREGGPAMATSIRDYDYGEVKIPETDEVIDPKYPKGSSVDPNELGTLRQQLAIWMVSRENPYMPKAVVNWAWSHFFGQGFVHPIDDFNDSNPASHPELLDKLSKFFVKSKYDMRRLIRVIVSSQAYHLSGAIHEKGDGHPEYFVSMPPKVFSPEQLYDSLNLSMGQQAQPIGPQGFPVFSNGRAAFISKMRSLETDRKLFEGGLPQALLMMNGEYTAFSTDPAKGRLVGSLSAPFFTSRQQIETLFLATYSRFPKEKEFKVFDQYLTDAKTDSEKQNALGDMLWALVNSAEFTINH